jgi:hypothetical protein
MKSFNQADCAFISTSARDGKCSLQGACFVDQDADVGRWLHSVWSGYRRG